MIILIVVSIPLPFLAVITDDSGYATRKQIKKYVHTHMYKYIYIYTSIYIYIKMCIYTLYTTM